VLTAFARAFQTPDLRKKLLFTLGMVVLFRLGAHIPTPGVSYQNVQYCLSQIDDGNSGLFGLVNMFSGGALMQLTIFALGIMPYITASIILQLLVVVIPRLEALKKEGQAGQAKITQYTRYLTVVLAILQSVSLIVIIRTGGEQLFGVPIPGLIPDDALWISLHEWDYLLPGKPFVGADNYTALFDPAALVELVGVAAGETANPEKIMPRAINSIMWRIGIFYVGSVVLLAMLMPWSAYSADESPFVTVLSNIGVPAAGDVMNLVVLTAAMSSLNSGLYSTGRILRSMSMAHSAPKFTAVMNRNGVPYGGIMLTAAVCVVGVGLNYFAG
jgi:hypothetical protein